MPKRLLRRLRANGYVYTESGKPRTTTPSKQSTRSDTTNAKSSPSTTPAATVAPARPVSSLPPTKKSAKAQAREKEAKAAHERRAAAGIRAWEKLQEKERAQRKERPEPNRILTVPKPPKQKDDKKASALPVQKSFQGSGSVKSGSPNQKHHLQYSSARQSPDISLKRLSSSQVHPGWLKPRIEQVSQDEQDTDA